MSATVATALLRQLQATFDVRLVEVQYPDSKAGRETWKITATSGTGETWTSRHEDRYKAACGLAELMGFELEVG